MAIDDLGNDQLVDEVLQALEEKGRDPAETTVLRGYLQVVDTLGRIYTSASLDHYVEFDAKEIIHRKRLNYDAGSLVWLPSTLPLHHVQKQPVQRPIEARFLAGGIAGAHLARAAAGQPWPGPPGCGPPPTTTQCPPPPPYSPICSPKPC
jgi:hypothetical protein